VKSKVIQQAEIKWLLPTIGHALLQSMKDTYHRHLSSKKTMPKNFKIRSMVGTLEKDALINTVDAKRKKISPRRRTCSLRVESQRPNKSMSGKDLRATQERLPCIPG
jgi:hypothetical protein